MLKAQNNGFVRPILPFKNHRHSWRHLYYICLPIRKLYALTVMYPGLQGYFGNKNNAKYIFYYKALLSPLVSLFELIDKASNRFDLHRYISEDRVQYRNGYKTLYKYQASSHSIKPCLLYALSFSHFMLNYFDPSMPKALQFLSNLNLKSSVFCPSHLRS